MHTALPPDGRVVVALDTPDVAEVEEVVAELGPWVAGFKVGYELGYAVGWRRAAELVTGRGHRLFLDAKLNDIPRTTAAGVRAVAGLDPWAITVHASAGADAVAAAVRDRGRSMIIAVTVLTSLGDAECAAVFGATAGDRVLSLARSAQAAGVDGIVCSPADLRRLSSVPELAGLVTITPGVRPSWARPPDDQARVATPAEAVRAGADYLVVGRPIVDPPPPLSRLDAVRRIVDEIDGVR